jgi:hypothetical protein
VFKADLQEVGCGALDWIDQAQDRDRWRAIANEITWLHPYVYVFIFYVTAHSIPQIVTDILLK